mgnify:CR=1 FL=1
MNMRTKLINDLIKKIDETRKKPTKKKSRGKK